MAKLFEKELKEIARIIAGLIRASQENDPALDKQLEKINSIFDDFSKKYPKLSLKIHNKIDELIVYLFINDGSVKDVFDKAASKIKGLTAIGLRSFDEATIQDAEGFASAADKIKNSLFLTYSLDFGIETIVLEFNSREKKVELNYEIKSIANPLTPQSQLLAKYAAMESDKDIEILHRCYELGFTDIEDDALFEWEDEFWPRMID